MSLLPDEVIIVDYDPAWRDLFERERLLLQNLFGRDARIEHVGSTAVPGLGAKPIVDIMVGVAQLREIETLLPALAEAGYAYVPEFETEIPERRFFRKPGDGPGKIHLHCVSWQSQFFREHIVFRDELRNRPALARDYLRLKQQLASRYHDNRSRYTAEKAGFILDALASLSDEAEN